MGTPVPMPLDGDLDEKDVGSIYVLPL